VPTLNRVLATSYQQLRSCPRRGRAGALVPGPSDAGAGRTWRRGATSATPSTAGSGWLTRGRRMAHWPTCRLCFVWLARTGSRAAAGLSYLLVPMRQPAVTVRPIRQLTGTSSSTRCSSTRPPPNATIVAAVGDGWADRPCHARLRSGRATLGQQVRVPARARRLVERPVAARGNRSVSPRQARPGVIGLDSYARARPGHEWPTRAAYGTWRQASLMKLLCSRWHRGSASFGHGNCLGILDGGPGRPMTSTLSAAVPVIRCRHDLRRVR